MNKYIRTGIIFSIIFIVIALTVKYHADHEVPFVEGGNIQQAIDTNQW